MGATDHAALLAAAGFERFLLDRLRLDGEAPLRCEAGRARRARRAARVVLAKHTCVTGGGGTCGLRRPGVAVPQPEGDRSRVDHGGEDIVGGQDAAGAGGS